jgi:DNA-binding response OmpR family regulator
MARLARLVFVDDEPDLAEALSEYFADLGYDTAIASSAWALETLLRQQGADLVILDLNLPGRDGFDILKDAALLKDVAVIILTANPDAIDRVIGLELGADDYVQKPVDPRELAARVATILRRRQGLQRPLVHFEAASVDLLAARLLRADGSSERLSASEIALIRSFADCAGRVLTREQLIELAPGETSDAFDRSIDARITRLRRKLATGSIRTVRGHGYVFDPPEPGKPASADSDVD